LQGKGLQVKRKRYSRQFQQMAVDRMKTSENIGALAHELGVTRRVLYKWRDRLEPLEPGTEAPLPNSHEASFRKQLHQVKRLLAEKTMEVDVFKGALQKIEARRQASSGSGEPASTTKFRK
jgi:transposase-like protein